MIVKSKKTSVNGSSNINLIRDDTHIYTEQIDIADAFNIHFTTIQSESKAAQDRCVDFIEDHFSEMINVKEKFQPNCLKFVETDQVEVDSILSELLSASSPGASEISIKVQTSGKMRLLHHYTKTKDQTKNLIITEGFQCYLRSYLKINMAFALVTLVKLPSIELFRK